MLYAVLKLLMKGAFRLYFGRIVTDGLEHIDNGGPTLILANHTGSFLDAMVTACFVKRRIHFFTRGDVFRYKWADAIMRSLGMLPIYRLRDGRDKLQLNDTSNEEALKILAKGGAVLIFAEGESRIDKVMKPLKKGPFRLAAAAAATLPDTLVLVPMGINYIAQTRPGSDVYLVAGAPLQISAETEPAKIATDAMRRTAIALTPLVWHVGRPEEALLADWLLIALQESGRRHTFGRTQLAMAYVQAYPGLPAQKRRLLLRRWSAISIDQIRRGRLLLMAGAPLAVLGWAFHKPAIWLAGAIARRKVSEPDFFAPVFLCCTVLLMIAWYAAWLILAASIRPSWLWLASSGLMAACGVFYRKFYWPPLRKSALIAEAIGILTPRT